MSNLDLQPAKWVSVLMYHRVVDAVNEPDPYHLCISTSNFEAQMAYLSQRGYETIALDDVPLAMSNESPWRKPIAITFDDGYRDNYTHALPILCKYRQLATIMLVSECIGGQNNWDIGKAATAPLLSLSELQEMRRYGIRFGAHTASHPSLPELTIDEVRHELSDSKRKLEALLDCEVNTLAYPYGKSSPEICHVARETGYIAAFGTEQPTRSLHNIRRIDAARCKGDTFLWRLKQFGAYHWLRQHKSLGTFTRIRTRMREHIRL